LGLKLSAGDFATWLVALFGVSTRTAPPHPFARALGAGLGLPGFRATPIAAEAERAPTPPIATAAVPASGVRTVNLGGGGDGGTSIVLPVERGPGRAVVAIVILV